MSLPEPTPAAGPPHDTLLDSAAVGRLLACPFCRELYTRDESTRCPQCDLPLVPMERLPLSLDAQAEQDARPYVPPEYRRLSPWFWRRGRGVVAALALCGLGLFFAPWVHLTHADEVTLRGFDLARGNATWLWGGAVGWFLSVPLVLSRRSVVDLRGIRVIAATFAAMTLVEVGFLLVRPPAEHGYFSYGLAYAWGLYASGVVSLVAVVAALRLGGRVEDLRDLPPDEVHRASSALH